MTKTTTARIVSVDRASKTITLSSAIAVAAVGDFVTVQNSKGFELTGLGAIFSNSDLYGLSRANNQWLKPYVNENIGAMDVGKIQSAIDYADEVAGGAIDFIVCAYDVKRFYLTHMNNNRTNVDFMNIDGGYKAMSYNGVPIVADRFIKNGDMYLLNSKDFKMHQLCDWRWLEGEGGNVIKQKQGQATYSATLVKYADMVCDKPIGQIKLGGFTE